jgi:hypothetical protein
MCNPWKKTFTLVPLAPLTMISPYTILLKRYSNLIFFPSNTSYQKFPISQNFNRIHVNIIKNMFVQNPWALNCKMIQKIYITSI